MKELNKKEISILKDLKKLLIDDEVLTLTDNKELEENDLILKVRELVFNIDTLVQKGYLEVEEGYYEQNENVTFKYVNSAVAIDTDKIKFTDTGLDKFVEMHITDKPFTERMIFIIFTYILTFVLGMIVMYIIKS